MTTATKKPAKKSAKSKKPAKPTKEQKQELIAEKLDELMKIRHEHAVSCIAWQQAHAEAGSAKKHMEKLQADMNGIVGDIEHIRSGNYTLPLPFGKPDVPTATVPADGDQRMSYPLAKLFDGAILKSLAEAKIETVGDLAEWSKTKQLSDIPGIGPGKGGKIEDRLIQFWAENPAPAVAEPVETESVEPSVENSDAIELTEATAG